MKSNTGLPDWIYDSGSYVAHVDVHETSPGQFLWSGYFNKVPVEFKNHYTGLAKVTEGKDMQPGQFTFGIYLDGKKVAEGSNIGGGKSSPITFGSFNFGKAGRFQVTAREESTSSNGWTADGHEIKAAYANVAYDAVKEDYVVSMEYFEDPKFVNRYYSIFVQITVQKHVAGASISGLSGNFSFDIVDTKDGMTVGTATNDENGELVFDTVEIVSDGIYVYNVVETGSASGNFEIDFTPQQVTVEVSKDGDSGELLAEVSPSDPLDFYNTYGILLSDEQGGVGLQAIKRTNVPMAQDGMFSFVAIDEETGKKLFGTSNSLGQVTFDDALFTETGVTTYVIGESNESEPSWTLDTNTCQAVVTVSKEGPGDKLSIGIAYAGGELPVFVNSKFTVKVSAAKIGVNGTLKNRQFSFGLFNKTEKKRHWKIIDERLFHVPNPPRTRMSHRYRDLALLCHMGFALADLVAGPSTNLHCHKDAEVGYNSLFVRNLIHETACKRLSEVLTFSNSQKSYSSASMMSCSTPLPALTASIPRRM